MDSNEVVRYIRTPTTATRILANHNMHSAFLYHDSEKFRKFYEIAEKVLIDGMPLLWLANLRGRRLPLNNRIGSTDWIHDLLATTSLKCPIRIFILGGSPTTSKSVGIKFQNILGLTVQTFHGYFQSEEADLVVREINDFKPDLLLVGLGMPKQEFFVLDNLDKFNNFTIATVGGAIDYLAGANKLAPRFIGTLGFEWLWRFVFEPRRLFSRYFIEPILLLRLIVKSRLTK